LGDVRANCNSFFWVSESKNMALHRSKLRVYAVEGNVGSGKSELLHALGQRGYFVVPEPIPMWGDTLKAFYDDPSRNSYLFQTRILVCAVEARLKGLEIARAQGHEVVFVERSFLGAQVFVDAARDNGSFSDAEYETYKMLERNMIKSLPPDGHVQLRAIVDTDVATCCSRIKARGRVGEDSGPLMSTDAEKRDYIQQIEVIQNRIFGTEALVRLPGQDSPDHIAERLLSHLRLPPRYEGSPHSSGTGNEEPELEFESSDEEVVDAVAKPGLVKGGGDGLSAHAGLGVHAGLGAHAGLGVHAGLGAHTGLGAHAGLGAYTGLSAHTDLGAHTGRSPNTSAAAAAAF